MKITKTLAFKIIIVGAIAVVAVSLLSCLSGLAYIIIDVKKGQQREKHLLCETDYQALLDACRELTRRVTLGSLKPGQYNVRITPHPEASRFPKPILNLEPTYVIIESNGSVMIELHGGFLHYGALAYPEGFEAPYKGFNYGDKELVPGLWYYNEDYENNIKLQKKIDELLQRRK